MTRKVVAIDIDDTLLEHFRVLMDWYNSRYGTHLTLTDYHSDDVSAWGVRRGEDAIRRVHQFFDSPEHIAAEPFPDAQRALAEIARNHDLVIVTARDTIQEEFTHTWLERHFSGLYREVHFTATYSLEGKSRSKLDVCQKIGVDYIIDDKLDTCMEMHQAGITAILFGNYPWNQTNLLPEGMMRCGNWDEVRKYFQTNQETLRQRVESFVADIPPGRVMTYGQLATLAGNPRAARIVGGIAHFGNPDLPWQRVVNKQGCLAAGYPGGRKAHKEHLESEGVIVHGDGDNFHVDIQSLLWQP